MYKGGPDAHNLQYNTKKRETSNLCIHTDLPIQVIRGSFFLNILAVRSEIEKGYHLIFKSPLYTVQTRLI